MTSGQAKEPRSRRTRLGQELRSIRMLAGLSGREVGRITGISQATISRVERGESLPSLPEVVAWADAIQAPADRRAMLLELTEAAVNEVVTFRDRLRDGLAAVQESVRDRESTARTLRNFQPGIIPGLLQTAGYARRIMAFADIEGAGGHASAVAARLDRQAILHEPSRSFEFLVTEAALRYRPGPPEVLTAQLDHLSAVATLETISFGVIPADAEMHAITRCGFVLYENRAGGQDPFVVIETPHASLVASDPSDVQVYRDQLARFRESASYGPEALAIVRAIAHP